MSVAVRSVEGRTTVEKVIEKSRFIACCAHVASEEEAKAFLAEIRREYPQATHYCYGFVADKTGIMQRFSDDGEPQGTAGMPILEVIKNRNLYETAVVVVRYFGGVKLGAGGLVRAYASSASDVLSAASVRLWRMGSEWEATVGYSAVAATLQYFSECGCVVQNGEYGDRVRFSVLVPKESEQAFCQGLTDRLSGRVCLIKCAEYYAPFGE